MDGIPQNAAGTLYSRTVGIGHNGGPSDTALDPDLLRDQLALDHAALLKKRDDLLAEARRFCEAFKEGPTNDEEQGRAGDMVKEIKVAAKEAEAAHKATKQPYLDCGRIVDGVLKQETEDKLKTAAKFIEGLMGKFLQRKAEAERKAREEQAAAAAREAQQLAAAAAAASNPMVADEIMEKAVAAADRADEATAAASAGIADLTRTRGSFGSVTSMQDKWIWRPDENGLVQLVAAAAANPALLMYLSFNESVIGAAVRAKGGVRAIPGLIIENQARAVVR